MANLVEMADEQGRLESRSTPPCGGNICTPATMVGRVAGGPGAVELGYAIEADPGRPGGSALAHRRRPRRGAARCTRSGRRRSTAECAAPGRALLPGPGVAARDHPQGQGHDAVEGELMARWRAELAGIGWPVERLAASIDAAAATGRTGPG